MTANHRKDALEVAHITGVQGIRAAMARLADEEADVPLPGAVTEEVPPVSYTHLTLPTICSV